jgi:NAD(P)H-nitrite reductase large subunit
MNNLKKYNYVIIGNSAGGIGAAEAIREIDKIGTMAVISDELYHVYSRPMISEYLSEKSDFSRMLYRPENFYDKEDIQAILGVKVEQIDPHAHTIKLDNQEIIGFESLLLAAGGKAIVPKLKGIELNGVFNFITLNDAKAVLEYSKHNVQRAVVIGGGLIGVSVTEALVKLGIKVTIVEMKEHLLNTMLDEESSLLVESKLTGAGVDIITGETVVEIVGSPFQAVSGIKTNSGRDISCQMVITAIGVQPRSELAAEAGIKVNRGIAVDRRMMSSVPGIYACGDAAEAYDFVYNENRLTPIWPNAYLGGRIAGLNMAGSADEYPGGTSMNSLKYFGLTIVSAGMVYPPDNSFEVLIGRNKDNCKKVILKDGCIKGMILINDIETAGIIFNLMKNRVNVESFKESLVAEDFGLPYIPDEIWRPKFEPDKLLRKVYAAAE